MNLPQNNLVKERSLMGQYWPWVHNSSNWVIKPGVSYKKLGTCTCTCTCSPYFCICLKFSIMESFKTLTVIFGIFLLFCCCLLFTFQIDLKQSIYNEHIRLTFQVTKPFENGLKVERLNHTTKRDTLPLMLVCIICQWILINTRWHSDCFILNRHKRKWITHTDTQNAIYQSYGTAISLLKWPHLLIEANVFFHFKMTILPSALQVHLNVIY